MKTSSDYFSAEVTDFLAIRLTPEERDNFLTMLDKEYDKLCASCDYREKFCKNCDIKDPYR